MQFFPKFILHSIHFLYNFYSIGLAPLGCHSGAPGDCDVVFKHCVFKPRWADNLWQILLLASKYPLTLSSLVTSSIFSLTHCQLAKRLHFPAFLAVHANLEMKFWSMTHELNHLGNFYQVSLKDREISPSVSFFLLIGWSAYGIARTLTAILKCEAAC